MRALRRRRHACALLALLSVFALSLGPTVSRLLLPAGGALVPGAAAHSLRSESTGEAMAPGGGIASAHHHHHQSEMLSVAAPAPPPAPAHEHALEHCGLCLLAAHGFTFVQERPALTAFVECSRPALDGIAPSAPRLRGDWSPASSRGPPVLV